MKASAYSPVKSDKSSVGSAQKKRIMVLYGSETGTAEDYAYQTAERLHDFACHVSVGLRIRATIEVAILALLGCGCF